MQLKPWHIKSSEYLIDDKWLRVRADECKTDSGDTVAPYYVLEYPDWVQIAAFDPQMRLLVNYEYRHGHQRIGPELPCGRIDIPGESPLETARRELLEETGCASDHIARIGVFSPNTATHTNQVHFFLAYQTHRISAPHFQGAESIVSEFIPVSEVLQLIQQRKFNQAMHIAHLFLAFQHAGLLSFNTTGSGLDENMSDFDTPHIPD